MNIIVGAPHAAAAAAEVVPPPPQAAAAVAPPPPQPVVVVTPPPQPVVIAPPPPQQLAVMEAVDCEVCGHSRAEKHGCGRAQVAAAKASKATSKKLRRHKSIKAKKW